MQELCVQIITLNGGFKIFDFREQNGATKANRFICKEENVNISAEIIRTLRDLKKIIIEKELIEEKDDTAKYFQRKKSRN